MVEQHLYKIKTGGFLSPKLEVMLEEQHMQPVAGGDARSYTMYTGGGRRIGKMEFERTGRACKIYKITVDEWKTDAFARGFVEFFMKQMKKFRVNSVTTEIFDTDQNTHSLLKIFKKAGYSVNNVGNVTGYNQYEVTWTG